MMRATKTRTASRGRDDEFVDIDLLQCIQDLEKGVRCCGIKIPFTFMDQETEKKVKLSLKEAEKNAIKIQKIYRGFKTRQGNAEEQKKTEVEQVFNLMSEIVETAQNTKEIKSLVRKAKIQEETVKGQQQDEMASTIQEVSQIVAIITQCAIKIQRCFRRWKLRKVLPVDQKHTEKFIISSLSPEAESEEISNEDERAQMVEHMEEKMKSSKKKKYIMYGAAAAGAVGVGLAVTAGIAARRHSSSSKSSSDEELDRLQLEEEKNQEAEGQSRKEKLKQHATKFHGKKQAATKIQSLFRGWFTRKDDTKDQDHVTPEAQTLEAVESSKGTNEQQSNDPITAEQMSQILQTTKLALKMQKSLPDEQQQTDLALAIQTMSKILGANMQKTVTSQTAIENDPATGTNDSPSPDAPESRQELVSVVVKDNQSPDGSDGNVAVENSTSTLAREAVEPNTTQNSPVLFSPEQILQLKDIMSEMISSMPQLSGTEMGEEYPEQELSLFSKSPSFEGVNVENGEIEQVREDEENAEEEEPYRRDEIVEDDNAGGDQLNEKEPKLLGYQDVQAMKELTALLKTLRTPRKGHSHAEADEGHIPTSWTVSHNQEGARRENLFRTCSNDSSDVASNSDTSSFQDENSSNKSPVALSAPYPKPANPLQEYESRLTEAETKVFGKPTRGINILDRLQNMELYVFGELKSGSIKERSATLYIAAMCL